MSAPHSPAPRVAVYPGSFDPVTNGHLDIIRRGARLFDLLIVAVAPASSNPRKQPLFPTAERVRLLSEATADLPNVEVRELQGLLVDYAAAQGARVILKGLRAISDFEYEYAMALMNHRLQPEIEAVFMMTSAHYSYLSSSLVKEVARLGGSLDGLVPDAVQAALHARFAEAGAPASSAQAASPHE
jgi:pantetheine-phosphate adenylyltransferase